MLSWHTLMFNKCRLNGTRMTFFECSINVRTVLNTSDIYSHQHWLRRNFTEKQSSMAVYQDSKTTQLLSYRTLIVSEVSITFTFSPITERATLWSNWIDCFNVMKPKAWRKGLFLKNKIKWNISSYSKVRSYFIWKFQDTTKQNNLQIKNNQE